MNWLCSIDPYVEPVVVGGPFPPLDDDEFPPLDDDQDDEDYT